MADKLDTLWFNADAKVEASATACFEYIEGIRNATEDLKGTIDEDIVRLNASADAGDMALREPVADSSVAICVLLLKLQLLSQNSHRISYQDVRSVLWRFARGLPRIGEREYGEVPDLYPRIASAASEVSTRLSELVVRTVRDSAPENESIARAPPAARASPPPLVQPTGSALYSRDVETSADNPIGMNLNRRGFVETQDSTYGGQLQYSASESPYE